MVGFDVELEERYLVWRVGVREGLGLQHSIEEYDARPFTICRARKSINVPYSDLMEL